MVNASETSREAGLQSAVAELRKQQHEAMERATFVAMTGGEKRAYDDRAEAINLLQKALDKPDAHPHEDNL